MNELITEKIIGCGFTVLNTLGCGFLEKVYENALAYELRKQGLAVEQQVLFKVMYDDIVVGDYCADLIVDGVVIVEPKAVKTFDDIHLAQCINYLKATGLRTGLLLNFGCAQLGIKRVSS